MFAQLGLRPKPSEPFDCLISGIDLAFSALFTTAYQTIEPILRFWSEPSLSKYGSGPLLFFAASAQQLFSELILFRMSVTFFALLGTRWVFSSLRDKIS